VPVQHYVLLVYWLFGTWKSFKERCKWVATINYPTGSHISDAEKSSPSKKDLPALLDENRRICINYMLENINATRAEFLEREYKCFRWLKRNDADWLDRHLPVSSRADVQLDLF
jgi:hypothetical protein